MPPLPANFDIPVDEAEGFYCRRLPDTTNMAMYETHPVKYWNTTEWRQYMYGYDRLVEKVDNHVLDIVNAMEQLGLLDNTIIIYTADHGDGHASHHWNQKMTFYEESINIPLIISWRGKTVAGKIDKKTLSSNGLDIYPTICRMAGIPYSNSLFGKDLSPNFLKDAAEKPVNREYIVSEITQNSKKGKQTTGLTGRMIVSEKYKYILFDKGANREQLFDLINDSGELHPRTKSTEYSNPLIAHRQMLKDWIVKTGDSFPVESIPK